jgi:hypothetical protein
MKTPADSLDLSGPTSKNAREGTVQMLHDPEVRIAIETRVKALRPDAPRKWGAMTPEQMLWHVSQLLSFALGQGKCEPQKAPMPLPILRFLLLNMPWPTGAPTNPNALAKDTYDFDAERERLLGLIGEFTSKPVDGPWPFDPSFGAVTGRFASKLQAKHLDYHLRQFNT